MTISFNEIPYDWLKPGTYMEVAPVYDRAGLLAYPARAILFCQMLATGSATPKQLYRITRADQGRGLFGAGSVGQQMVEAFKASNKTTDLYAVGISDVAGGTAATGSFAFTGTATAAGSLPLYIGTQRIPVTVSTGMTAAQVATAAAAAVATYTALGVTGVAATSTLTLTARHKGEVGNHIHLAVARQVDDTIPTGITVAVTAMSGGTTNPVVQELLDVIASQWFTDIVVPWDDSTTLSTLATNLAARFLAMGKLDAHAYLGTRGTFSAITTKGGVTNSPFMSLIGAKGSPSAPWEWAAALAAVSSFQLANDPARQLRGLTLTGIQAPGAADQFIETEQNLLLNGGISTFLSLTDGTVALDRVVTTYKTSSLGVADRAWLDIMIPKTASRVRYDWNGYVALTYPRCKLAPDGSRAADADASGAVVTPKRMRGSWAARCQLYEERGWITDASDTVSRSVFEIDASDKNRMNAQQPIEIIGNLMVLAGRLLFEV